MTEPVRPAAVPVRPARRGSRAVAERHEAAWSTSRSARPCDPPPERSCAALRSSGAERGYPPSIGTPALPRRGEQAGSPDASASTSPAAQSPRASAPRSSSARCRSGCVCVDPTATPCSIPAVATRPTRWARSSPAAGRCPCRSTTPGGSTSTRSTKPTPRGALCLWVNTPGNPTGALDDLAAAAAWGRAHGVPVFSDECYVEFTWDGPPRTILEHGIDGVVAVHSLSKRSNLAGRAGRLLRRRPRAGHLPAARCASTSG